MQNLHDKNSHQRLKKGIFFSLVSWFFFATSYLVSKLIGPETSVSTMIFFRGLMGVLITLPWMLKNYKSSFKTSRPGLVLIRSLTATLNTAFIYLAVQSISLVDSTLLMNTAPIFVPFLVWIILKKRIDFRLWIPIFLGLIGIALVLKPDWHFANLGGILAIGSGICTAISILMTRMITTTEKMYTVLFYSFLLGCISAVPFAWAYWKIASFTTLLSLIGLGILPVLGQWGLFRSLAYGKASHIACFSYSSVVYSALFEWIFFHQTPDLWVFLGMGCVFIGGIVILFLSANQKNASPDSGK